LHAQLCQTFPNAEILGIDINATAVGEMRKKGLNVLVADAEDMHLDTRFNSIVAGELIEHLSNPGSFLQGCRRHLKPEGRVILSTPNPFSLMYYLMYLKNFKAAFNPEHALWFCPQTLTELARRCDFQVTKLAFADDLRPEIVSSLPYRIFALLYRGLRMVLPNRLGNTIVVVLKPS
jgi:SAM-dependent methyltransferase